MSNQHFNQTPTDTRFYGRRHGKKLKESRLFLMDNLLPRILIEKSEDKRKASDLFGFCPKEVWLEVGFGGGEHLAGQAFRHPDIGFVGAEPFLNGVASLLVHLNTDDGAKINQDFLINPTRNDNVRVYPDDIRHLFPSFEDKSFAKIFVLYPDPWPKARHEDRRFLNPNNLPELYRLLSDDGELRVATDVEDYGLWAQETINASGLFTLKNQDIRTPPQDWISTRYEQKGLKAGRKPMYLTYVKK